ncbi:hypothetical protein [Bacillus sp. CHD6a]|uniref:hypothetical protein n=1 Tax=Bacillus sp. CHD6a TaxID=1643452 RepID=UPI0006CD67B3|nr:hypothetical protein [Bacillus sp. CHD6a]KPB04735.1 hypothetical protein AAV98_10510 [Bacillus sp. CHD6a]
MLQFTAGNVLNVTFMLVQLPQLDNLSNPYMFLLIGMEGAKTQEDGAGETPQAYVKPLRN